MVQIFAFIIRMHITEISILIYKYHFIGTVCLLNYIYTWMKSSVCDFERIKIDPLSWHAYGEYMVLNPILLGGVWFIRHWYSIFHTFIWRGWVGGLSQMKLTSFEKNCHILRQSLRFWQIESSPFPKIRIKTLCIF